MTEVYNTISIYRPNQANVLGSPDQVYMMDNLTEYIVKGIKVGSISAIGTPNENTSLLCIVFPPSSSPYGSSEWCN